MIMILASTVKAFDNSKIFFAYVKKSKRNQLSCFRTFGIDYFRFFLNGHDALPVGLWSPFSFIAGGVFFLQANSGGGDAGVLLG